MPIEFTHVPGENRTDAAASTPFFHDVADTAAKLSLVEEAGFRRIVVDDAAGLLSNMDIAAHALDLTSSLEVVLTHWAGVVAPVVAARQLAALDARSRGRLSLRMLSEPLGEEDAEARPAGHAAVWQRIDEYLVLLKRLWSNERPIDHEGAFYSVRGGHVPGKDARGPGITIRMGGASGTALRIAVRHADVFELMPGSVAETRQLIERVRGAAAEYGRAANIRFALPVRLVGAEDVPTTRQKAVNVSGTPAQIALSLLPYARLGIGEFMIAGIDEPGEIELFGWETMSLLRNSVARHQAGMMPTGRLSLRSAHSGLRYGRS